MELKNKKILIVATTDDMVARFMIPHINQLKELGAKIECACNVNKNERFEKIIKQTGIKIHDISFTRFPFTLKNFKARGKLVTLCKNNKYNLIHCLQPVGGVMGRMMAKKFKIPVIYVAHGFHFYKGAPIQNNLIYKSIERHYAKYTTALVTMNEEDFLAAKKFKAKKVYKINGIGIDLKKYKQDNKLNLDALRKELGIEKKDFVVLTVGELNKNKNTDKVFKAIKEIPDNNLKYLVCGAGPREEEYKNFVKENHLEDRIKILGFRSDIPEIFSLSNVYVMPSFREGLPRATMEAMAYGLPIIASNIRGCRDLIENDVNGLLINPKNYLDIKNSILKLQQDENLCKKFGGENLTRIKNFRIEVVLGQMLEIYREM